VAPRQALEAASEDAGTEALMPWQRQLLQLAPREETLASTV